MVVLKRIILRVNFIRERFSRVRLSTVFVRTLALDLTDISPPVFLNEAQIFQCGPHFMFEPLAWDRVKLIGRWLHSLTDAVIINSNLIIM